MYIYIYIYMHIVIWGYIVFNDMYDTHTRNACEETLPPAMSRVLPECLRSSSCDFFPPAQQRCLGKKVVDISGTLWQTDITLENHHVQWENQLHMAILNSYVSLPECILCKVNLPTWQSMRYIC